ncbi:pilus assembly protein CpaE [uncultured Pseudokineococcus sp.]|uniref:pilus assembly protein CpaE n=1 Tax=uncultured Pseudokineococcus sp. TaxID=1642928 RepID=UPI002634F486|nr:pilus assembly protein CpaE [uncultured Pseudokineococcus sp.]
MISVPTARALATSGVAWEPASGDRFVITDRGMDDDVFVLSEMVVEAQDHATGRVLGFNGTTEWALDSVAAEQAVWLPREGQLREMLGDAFAGLVPEDGAFVVRTRDADGERSSRADDVEEAYALAVLAVRARAARSA